MYPEYFSLFSIQVFVQNVYHTIDYFNSMSVIESIFQQLQKE